MQVLETSATEFSPGVKAVHCIYKINPYIKHIRVYIHNGA